MSAVKLSAAADQGLTQWDIGLSKTTACVVRARSSLYDNGILCNLLHALRDMRRYITRSGRREASPTLESAMTTVLSPLLQEFYAHEDSHDVLEELLEILVVLGQGVDAIIYMMGSQGIFHILTTILMYTPTTEIASACLGRLAGTSDLAAREAQIAILASGMALTCPPIPASAPESSTMAAIQAQQVCALPVVYKLLTAQDKGAQKVAIEMLTFLCDMGSEWQTHEQLTLAKFDNGVILANLVQRIKWLSNQTRLSTAKAAELARLLQLLSSATSGCEVAQSKVEEHHILQHLVTLLLPSEQRIKLVVTPSHDAGVVTKIQPHFKVSRRQMIELLIAMTNVVSQHAANQALLVSLAEPLTEALAAWLSTSPSTTLKATDAAEPPMTKVPSCASTSAQSDMAATKNSSTGAKPQSTATHTAAHDLSCKAQKPVTSALTSQLKGPKQPSLLTAELKESTQPKAETRDPSVNASPSASPRDAASTQRGESSKNSQRQEEPEVQLARRFVYHLLLHLPVDVLRDRQAFWMEHAVGLPELMQDCLGVAVMQEPTAVKSLCQKLQQWVHQPDSCSAEALQWLSNFPAVVQGLVQTVLGTAASEAIQILSLMSQQGGGVGGLLGAAGAAEAIVAAALARSDFGAFKTTKEVSDLVVRVLPDSQGAVNIIHECQTAILTATSTAVRHRAISIMRAMTNLLNATPPPQHDADREELPDSQPTAPAMPVVSPAAVEHSATDAKTGASSSNLSAEGSSDDRGKGPSSGSPEGCSDDSVSNPLTAQSASGPHQVSQSQSMEQAFAMEMLNRQCGAAQAKAQHAVAEADTEVGQDPEQEEEEEALAAARRQQLVDDAMDKMFEDMTDELPTVGTAPSDSHIHRMDTADSGVWVSASKARNSSAAAGTAFVEEEEGFREEEEEEEFEGEDEEKDEEEEEEEDEADLQALAILEMQGYTGLKTGFLQPPQAASSPTPSPTTGPDTGRGNDFAAPRQRLTGFKVTPLPAQATATESTPSKSTPEPTTTSATPAATAGGAGAAALTPQAAQAAATAKTVTRRTQPSKGLPSLALSRTSRKTVKPTPEKEEETVLLPSQQASGLTSPEAPHAREQGKQLSQAEMQELMDFVFQRGFERMGELAGQSLANNMDEPVTATAALVSVEAVAEKTDDEPATPTAARVFDEAVSEKTHDEMQDAFAKLVQDGLQRQGTQTRPELEGAALSQAVAGAITAPMKTRLTATPATAGSSVPDSTTEAAAAASTGRDHHAMDNVPKALVAKERVRVAQNHEAYDLPRFHSVFSRYGSDSHVREIQEMTHCQRQVGFAVKQTSFWQKNALKALVAVPSVILVSGIAKGVRPLRKKKRSG